MKKLIGAIVLSGYIFLTSPANALPLEKTLTWNPGDTLHTGFKVRYQSYATATSFPPSTLTAPTVVDVGNVIVWKNTFEVPVGGQVCANVVAYNYADSKPSNTVCIKSPNPPTLLREVAP